VEIMPKKSKGNAVVTLIGVLAMGLVSIPALYAAENDCSALMKSLSKTGEVPAIVINPVDETVKIISTRGECSETIEAWSKRDAPPSSDRKPAKSNPAAAPKTEPKPQPKAVTVTPKPGPADPGAPEPFKKLMPRQTFTPAPDSGPEKKLQSPPPVTSPRPVVKKRDPQANCDYRLGEIWESQVIKIAGIDHWLARAFTMDINADLKVDNISFFFVAKDGSEKVVHYFGAPGEVSGRVYPALTLPDESLIGRLCFDDLKYNKPKFFDDRKLQSTLIEIEKPDLAGELDAKQRGVVYKSKTAKKKPARREGPTPWWVWAASGGGALVVVAGAVLFVLRRRKKAKKTGDEDEKDDAETEDDEEDDGEKPKNKKKGLGALIARFKKKPKKSEDEDEEDFGDQK
jgi:hypothetical protein